jgi:hypothetical protein
MNVADRFGKVLLCKRFIIKNLKSKIQNGIIWLNDIDTPLTAPSIPRTGTSIRQPQHDMESEGMVKEEYFLK